MRFDHKNMTFSEVTSYSLNAIDNKVRVYYDDDLVPVSINYKTRRLMPDVTITVTSAENGYIAKNSHTGRTHVLNSSGGDTWGLRSFLDEEFAEEVEETIPYSDDYFSSDTLTEMAGLLQEHLDAA
jgi:hypothetical protein